MDRNMLLLNKLTHSHKTSRKFRAEQYCPPSQGGKKDQTPPSFPPLRRGGRGGESRGASNASENRSRQPRHRPLVAMPWQKPSLKVKRDVDQADERRHFHQRTHDGGERRPGIDAEYRDRHGYRQLEIVACRLINSHA